jgi:hypothetical protein
VTISKAGIEQFIVGQFAANGDYVVEITTSASSGADIDLPPPVVELLFYDEVAYVNLHISGTLYAGAFPDIEQGWHSRDDLYSSLSDVNQENLLESITTIRQFKDIPFAEMMLSVVEQESDIIGGVELRVFEVNLDALGMLIMQFPLSLEEQQQLLEELAEVIASGESTLNYTFWIGAEDGLLYQTESYGRYFWPYQSLSVPGMPYDQELIISSEYRNWSHGKVDEIDLPDDVAALLES